MATPLQLTGFAEIAPAVPMVLTLLTAMGVLVADLFEWGRGPRFRPMLALGGLALAFLALQLRGADKEFLAFGGSLRFDRVVFLAQNVILFASAFLVLLSPRFLKGRAIPQGEYFGLLLFAAAGMIALSASNDLLALFVNIETLSITLYVLAGIERGSHRSSEAAFKYFLMGSYAAAFLLFGLTLIYGATGGTHFTEIKAALAGGAPSHPLMLAGGVALMLVGFGFKLTLAPFHMYAPDLYDGAPTTVAGVIATGSKVAALAALLNLFRVLLPWPGMNPGLEYGFIAMTALTILVGNAGALRQPRVKRLLAYSGVAHAGYAMIPLATLLANAGDPAALGKLMPAAENAIAYYLLAYSLMTLLAFGVIASLPEGEGDTIDGFAGLSRRSPGLAAAMALALISLTGIPPTAGFLGKFYLFSVAAEGGLYGLAIFGVLASVASAYYYLRIIVKMYMEPGEAGDAAAIPGANRWALLAGAAAIFIFGFFPMLYLLD